MINAKDLKERMNVHPFKPFRICLSDGKAYDITNHDMMMVKPNAVLIGIDINSDDLVERVAECAIIHITRLEDISPAKAA